MIRIVGKTSDRAELPVTLDRCFETTDGWHVHTALLGKALSVSEEIAFREVRVRLSALNAWADVNGLGFEQDSWDDFRANWKRPPPFIAELDDRTEVKIAFGLDSGTWGQAHWDAHLSQESELRLLFPQTVDFKSIRRLANVIRNLASLGSDQSIRIERMVAYDEPHSDLVERFQTAPRRYWPFPETEIVYPMIERRDPRHEDNLNPLRMPFTLSDLPQGFDELVNRWDRQVDRLDDVLNLYLSVMHAPPRYPETRFLIYAQALEGYHRVTRDRSVWDEEEWRVIRSTLLEGLSPKVTQTLDRKLEQLNFIPLKSRVSDLMKLAPLTSAKMLQAGNQTRGEFLDLVEATRNGLAHGLVAPKSNAAKDRALWRLTTQLQTLFETMLFLELGFTDEMIEKQLLWRGRRFESMRVY